MPGGLGKVFQYSDPNKSPHNSQALPLDHSLSTTGKVSFCDRKSATSGQLRMAQGSTCRECLCCCSKLITARACVNQLYIKCCSINCDYITLALELPRKWADWMHSKFMLLTLSGQIVEQVGVG